MISTFLYAGHRNAALQRIIVPVGINEVGLRTCKDQCAKIGMAELQVRIEVSSTEFVERSDE